MNLDLPPETEAMRRSTREVVDDLLKQEPEFHRTGAVPATVDETFRRLGYYGLALPEEYGGANAGVLTSVVIMAELARLPPQFYQNLVQNMINTRYFYSCSAERRADWIPALAKGERTLAFALTEPNCGSDLYAMRTTAKRDGGSYVINGSKSFISNATAASGIIVVAYTDRSEGAKGISTFLVDPTSPGLTIGPPRRTMGWSLNGLYDLTFEDCRVPAENLLGVEGNGLGPTMASLSEARLMIGCNCVGAGDIAIEHSIDFAKDRITFGTPIAEHQVIKHMLADMVIEQHASRTMLIDAAWRCARGENSRLLSSIVKTFCSEAGGRIADRALQIHGGSGYMHGMVVERVYRDMRVQRIFDGSNEIQRNTIAKQIL